MSHKIENEMCEMCGKKAAQIKYIMRSCEKDASSVIVENVPVISYANCGESSLTVKTLHEIARIKLHRESFPGKRNLSVAEFV